MTNKKFIIQEVGDISLTIPEIEVIENNIPSPVRVTEKEYRKFIEDNKEFIKEAYSITIADTFVVKDYYDNVIARVNVYIENEYYINPKLLELGIEKKCRIENKTKVVGEKTINLGKIKPCDLNISNIKS